MKMRVLAALKLEKAIPFTSWDSFNSSCVIELDTLDCYSHSADYLIFFSCVLLLMAALKPSANSGCPVQNNLCAYMFQYGDGSDTPGFFVSDVLQSDIRLILMTLDQTCYLILE
ncbi:hypothetical protein Bca52824_015389 [Brassica carinata]|uniref:Uncharacterized protein n=1 Tax=Brassica carinata TaxID=52824 RepID=A0A8X7W207_BRACI|nr:hypothetical protein Bca52824_015389 [Brassica carinata]